MKRRSTPAPTQAQQSYQDRARELGCVVCLRRIELGLQPRKWGQCGVTHIHHRNFNDWHSGKRIGQGAVVALGAWHHDGVVDLTAFFGWSDEEMEAVFGPSFKYAGPFRDMTEQLLPHLDGRGTERWQNYQDELLGEFA